MRNSEAFDYIVVGGGSAGCLIAGQLAANENYRVLVVEAGSGKRSPLSRVPLGFARLYFSSRYNYRYRTVQQPGLNNRTLYVPRGKGVGGSAEINAMVYSRGTEDDFRHWEQSGGSTWSAERFATAFRAFECDQSSTAADGNGDDQCIHLTHAPREPMHDRFFDACAELGTPRCSDLNAPARFGVGYYDLNIRRGVRWSSYEAFVRHGRKPNLVVRSNCVADRLYIEDRVVKGVWVRRSIGSEALLLYAKREVILAAGAIGSPLVLERSGVGRPDVVRRAGLTPLVELPAVGEGLQDHLCAEVIIHGSVRSANLELAGLAGMSRAIWRYLRKRSGPLAWSPNKVGGFVRVGASTGDVNTQVYFNTLLYLIDPVTHRTKLDKHGGYSLFISPCHLASRGSVHVTNQDPFAHPVIDPRYLSVDGDGEQLVASLEWLQKLVQTRPMVEISDKRELSTFVNLTRDELLGYVKNNSGSIYHPCGTCAMNSDSGLGVVDERLRVHGLEGVRIADASIFPRITSGNLNANVMAVAMIASGIIMADAC